MTEHRGKRFKTSGEIAPNSASSTRTPRFKSSNQQQPTPAPQPQPQRIPDVVRTEEPFKVSPEVSGVLPKLDAGEGAVITNRSNAASTTGSFPPIDDRMLKASRRAKAKRQVQTQKKSPKRTIALIAGLAAVFFVIMFVMFSTPSEDVVQKTPQVPEQRVKVAQDGEVEFRDFIFSLSDSKGTWELIGRPKSGEGEVRKYLTFEGTPVSLILYEGGFIIPENLSNGTWDVVTYTVSDGSVVSKLVDSSGNPVGGSGKVSKAEVSGDTLKLTLDSGKTENIKLK